MNTIFIKAVSIAFLMGAISGCTETTAPPAQVPVTDLAAVSGFTSGSAGPVRATAYVFFDARCSHCADLYDTAKTVPEFRYQWVPVAVLGKASEGLGAIILSSDSPSATFENIKAGNAPRFDEAADAKRSAVIANTSYMQSRGATSVPYILLVEDGKVLAETQGALPAERLRQFMRGGI